MLTNMMKEDLVHGLLDIFADNILSIILYGSVARNDDTMDSDIDIAIIASVDKGIHNKITKYGLPTY